MLTIIYSFSAISSHSVIFPLLVNSSDDTCGWRCLFFIMAFLVLHAFFELASVALVRARLARIDELIEIKYSGAKTARKILERSEVYLICCQVWSFLTAFMAGAITIGLLLPTMTLRWAEATNYEFAFFSRALFYLFVPILVVASAIVLVQIAKSIAYAKPNRMLCQASYFLIPFHFFSAWAVAFLLWFSELVIRILHLKTASERDFVVSADEINEIVERSSKAGEIEHNEHEMIKSALEFAETIVSEVMTTRNDVVAAPITSTLAEIITIFKAEGHTRVLIYGKNLDDHLGIINAKDFVPLAAASPEADFNLQDYVRLVPAIMGTIPIQQALQILRKQSVHFAVVLNEYGGLDGIITMEDIVEQVVGDIYDEYDLPEDKETVVTETKSGDLILEGGALIDDLNSEYDLSLPEGDYNTIAGFMIEHLGKIPMQGESLVYNGFLLTAEEVNNNRVNLVRLILNKHTES